MFIMWSTHSTNRDDTFRVYCVQTSKQTGATPLGFIAHKQVKKQVRHI